MQLRHLDQIKGNFSVSERDYQATAVIQEAQPITQSMYTTVRSFIEQQRMYLTLYGTRRSLPDNELSRLKNTQKENL